MITYWDASALMLSLIDDELRKRVVQPFAHTRTHTLAELFSSLTGKHGPQRVSADDARQQLRELAEELTFIDLTAAEVLTALGSAQRRGVRGGRVHDYLHAVAAQKVKAERLLTTDENDFDGLIDAGLIEQV